ncbi:exodeoxyribonuclease III [uncultured Gammaproteobacteria bacterium]
MRLVTWNINSVRLRIELVLRVLEETDADVLCLQETKVPDPVFPLEALAERGYVHAMIDGMKGYNGVAIVSRLPLTNCGRQEWCGRNDRRHVFATLPGGVEVHSVYVPSGGDIPDPEQNPKFDHKLRFLDEMAQWWPQARSAERPMILAGDLNVAPLEHDVWSHTALLDVICHTPVEIERLNRVQSSLGWVDAMRRFVPPDQKLYTWWSYRAKDWVVSNRGRRIDHVWVTPPLVGALTDCRVLTAARGWEPKPSDHVPVVVDLAL